VDKVILNAGLSKGLKDASFVDIIEDSLRRISGQKPVKTKAKKSISNFKIRQGMIIGMKVTLRGKRMYDFLDKLINITLPRIRDFRGLDDKAVDKTGNMTIGLKEHIAFPEIGSDEIEKIHGLEIVINTTAKNKEEGYELFKALGFPFKKS
jgi:large subunit ribosomal protein L5